MLKARIIKKPQGAKGLLLGIVGALALNGAVYCGPCMAASQQGFEEPLPPPELGQKLTDYRTRQQLEESRRAGQNLGNKPQALSNNNATRATISSQDSSDGFGFRDPLLNDVNHSYCYAPNKRILLTRGGEAVVKLDFPEIEGARITKVETGNGFGTEFKGNTVWVWPTGHGSHSQLGITVQGLKRKLVFALNYSEYKYSERHNESVTVQNNCARIGRLHSQK